jgi:hypothetical protein
MSVLPSGYDDHDVLSLDAEFPEMSRLNTATLDEGSPTEQEPAAAVAASAAQPASGPGLSTCPESYPADVSEALCEPAAFEPAPEEFFTTMDTTFGTIKIRVCRFILP